MKKKQKKDTDVCVCVCHTSTTSMLRARTQCRNMCPPHVSWRITFSSSSSSSSPPRTPRTPAKRRSTTADRVECVRDVLSRARLRRRVPRVRHAYVLQLIGGESSVYEHQPNRVDIQVHVRVRVCVFVFVFACACDGCARARARDGCDRARFACLFVTGMPVCNRQY
jgi:hypothetical protein